MDSALDTIQYQRFFFLLRNHCRYLQLYFYVSCFYFVFADGDDGGGDDDDGGGDDGSYDNSIRGFHLEDPRCGWRPTVCAVQHQDYEACVALSI